MKITTRITLATTFIVLVLFSRSYLAHALTFTANSNGNWNIGTTWNKTSCASGCIAGTDFPGQYDGASITSKTVTLNANMSVGTTSILSTGILNLSSYILNVYNNFINNSTFNSNAGTVNLSGTNQYVTGVNSFYNLTKVSTTSGATLYFGIGTTTITGALTLMGTSSYPLSIKANEFDYKSITGTSANSNGVLSAPVWVVSDPSGNTYVTQSVSNGHLGVQKFDSSKNPLIQWGSSGTGAGLFLNSSAVGGVAYSTTTGNLYIVDGPSSGSGSNNRVQIFSSSGTFISMFGWGVATGASSSEICTSSCRVGFSSSGNGGFSNPIAVAVDGIGNVYVTDPSNSRVQKFDSSGNYITKWGTNATSTGNFSLPRGVVIDAKNGYAYVVDANGTWPRIEKFDLSGNYQSQIPSFGTVAALGGNGKLVTPSGIAIDSSGNIYITDTTTNLVQKFNSSGTFLLQWGGTGTTTGKFSFGISLTGGITVDSSDNVYVSDTGNNRVEVFDASGNFVAQYGTPINMGQILSGPFGVARDSSNNIYVTDNTANRIDVFDSSGNFLKAFGWSVSTTTASLQTCTSLYCRMGSAGSGNGQFGGASLNGLALDASNNIYTADGSNNRVQKFDSSGNYITKWGTSGTGAGQFSLPYGVAVDTANSYVYVTDKSRQRVSKFDLSGTFISMFGWGVATGASQFETCTSSCVTGISGSGVGQFNSPEGISVDSSGNVYVVDTGNSRVQKFNSSGAYVTQWGVNGFAAPSTFFNPDAVYVDSANNLVYVGDGGNNRIQVFDTSGNFIQMFGWGVLDGASKLETCIIGTCQAGVNGSGNGEFSSSGGLGLHGMTIDSSGNLYVVDVSRRIEKLHTIAKINPIGTVSASYLSVKDSNNVSGTSITCTNCTDAGNNIGWSFVSIAAPSISAQPANSITTTGATFNATILTDGGASTTVRGFNYGPSTSYGLSTSTTGTYGLGAFSMSATGMACNTVYHFQAFAMNSQGTGTSSDQTFTTSSCPVSVTPPLLTAASSTSIGTSSVTFNGSITSDGNASSTVRGFNYGASASYGSSVSENGTFGIGAFSLSATGLSCNTLYHYQSSASNSSGTGSSTDATFMTGACPATVTASSASSVSSSGATLNGSIASSGGATSTIVGFNYGLSTSYGTMASTTGTYGLGAFSVPVTGLVCHTTYHYQAFSVNIGGIGTSSDQTFTTSLCLSASSGGSFSSGSYSVSDLNSAQSASVLSDNDPTTYITLSRSGSVNPGFIVDMGTSTTVNRLYFTGTSTIFHDVWPDNTNTVPLGRVVVYVGDSTSTSAMTRAGEFMVPYDQSSPIDLDGDIRFSPLVGRYVRAELETAVNWYPYWAGWSNATTATTSLSWKVGEIEVHGFSGTYSNQDAVVIPPSASKSVSFAGLELSYYLSRIEKRPVPVVVSAATSTVLASYPGNIYNVMDLTYLAPDWNTMVANQNSGLLPTGINVELHGREIDFRAWPYRNLLESVWEFLRSEGVVWAYPDAHGDYVSSASVNLSNLPISHSVQTIYANWSVNNLQPWPEWVSQTLRNDYLYAWRNGWTFSPSNALILGKSEIPTMPSTGISLSSDYTEAFTGYPHNMNAVIPLRILNANPTWCGYVSASGTRVCSDTGNPAFDLSNTDAMNWVANKLAAVQASIPLNQNSTNYNYTSKVFQILPLDATYYDQSSTTIALNSPAQYDSVPYTKNYSYASQSNAYYNFVNEAAKKAKASNSSIQVGSLAYGDVWMAPPAIKAFSDNVRVEIGLYGSFNLPMNSTANAPLKKTIEQFRAKGAQLTTYDWVLLHTDYWQQNSSMPVPLVAGIIDRAKYLSSIGALTGGTQAYTNSIPYNPWNFYAYSRIRNNLSLTEDQILSEFFSGYFNEASSSMLAYYHDMEDWQQQNQVNLYLRGYADGITPGSFPLAVLAKMETDLKAAESSAQNWITASRVAAIRSGFNWILLERGLQGVTLSDTSSYQSVGTNNNPAHLNLQNGFVPDQGPYGNSGSVKSSGGYSWNYSLKGTVQLPLNFSQAGTYTFNITASASVPATLAIYAGPKSLGSIQVTNSSPQSYTATANIPAGYGVQDLTVMSQTISTVAISDITATLQSYTATVPTVTVQAPVAVGSTTVTMQGTVTSIGNASVIAEGFNLGADTFYDYVASTTGVFGTGTYTNTFSGLTPCATYHLQAYATNSIGTATSSDTIFTTSGCTDQNPPIVQITAPTNASNVSATIALAASSTDDVSVGGVQFYYNNTPINSVISTVGTSTAYATTWNTLAVADGAYTIYAVSHDTSGNTATSSVAITIDNTAPVTTASPAGGTFATNQSVALSCADASVGCQHIYYTTDGSLPTASSSQYASPISVSANTVIRFFSVDNNSNSESAKSQIYIIDTVAPVTTAYLPGGTYGTAQNVTLSCIDDNSGCGATYYTVDGSTPNTNSAQYSAPIAISANTQLKFFSKDAAGNAENIKTQSYIIDTTYPFTTISVYPPSLTTSTNAQFVFSANKQVTYQCKLDSGSFSTCTSPQTLSGVTEGAHTFYVRADDGLGHVEPSPAFVTWTVDTTNPSAFALSNPADASVIGTSSPLLYWNASSDSGSGLLKYQLYIDNTLNLDNINDLTTFATPSSSLTSGPHSWYVKAFDNVGNSIQSNAFNLIVATVPTVSDYDATVIASTGATLNGSIDVDGYASSTLRGFEYGTTASYGTSIPVSGQFGVGSFSTTLSDLSCGTTYYFRSFARNISGTASSQGRSFTTSACATAPVMTLSAPSATNVTATLAILNGSITISDGSVPTALGFNYGTSVSYGSTVPFGDSNGTSFSRMITGLYCGTTYHFQSFATALSGSYVSQDQTFITSSCQTQTSSTSSGGSSGGSGGGSSSAYVSGSNTTALSSTAAVATSKAAGSSSPVFTFTRTLQVGATGSDALSLQVFLNSHGYTVAKSGPGSLGNEINIFGPATKSALIRFQEAYTDSILAPYGLTSGTGIFGPATRAVVNGIISKEKGSTGNIGAATPASSSGSLSATSSLITGNRQLSIGSEGDDVKQLQIFLNGHGYPVSSSGNGSLGKETTSFGVKTKQALILFQKANGIPAIGIVGPKTRSAVSALLK